MCCVVPIGVAAVAGAAVAAPLAKLDDPLVISAASAVLAIPVWLWLKRRAARSAEARFRGTYGDHQAFLRVRARRALARAQVIRARARSLELFWATIDLH